MMSSEALEQPDFHYFECPKCEFSSVQSASFSGDESCPLCAGDSGHDVRMHRRVCLDTDRPEGRDARTVLERPTPQVMVNEGLRNRKG
jgi:hypothetical protein